MASIAQAAQSQQPAAQAIQSFVPKSSFLAFIEYDPVNLRMTSHLFSGAIYQHTFCLPMDFENLKTSQNHGKHWAKHIKGVKLGIRIKSAKSAKSERGNHGIKTG